MSNPILLYDGVCALCNRFVQFVLRHDSSAIFRFASLQSPLAAKVLARHSANPTDLDTVYLVLNPELPDEFILYRSQAVLFVLNELGGPFRPAALLIRLVPRFFRDFAYNVVARRRYRIFGRSEICVLPGDLDHSRFLDR